MANKALNQVSQVQSTELANVKTFLAVMNNGEIKQMSKEDMAAVVGGLLSISKKIVFIKGGAKTDTGITCKGLVVAKPSNSNTMTLFIVSTAANLIEEVKTLGDVVGVNSSLPLNISVENNTLHVDNALEVDRYLNLTMIQ